MKHTTTLLIALAAVWLPGSAALAQGSSSTNTNQVFPVRFSAACRSFDSAQGRIVTTRLTERNIIAQALGTSPADRTSLRNFALAYNAAEDSLQVVDSNRQAVVDVIHFGGGVAIADTRQIDRFTFLFFPGQTNELGAETNVFGSALITERTNRFRLAGAGPSITGQLQFFLTDGNVLGATNRFTVFGGTNLVAGTNGMGTLSPTNSSGFGSTGLSGVGFVMTNANIVFDTNATICVGTFTTLGHGPPLILPPFIGSGTNGVGSTNTITTTNSTTGVGGTNGTGMTGTTNASNGASVNVPGRVPGFNTVTATTVGAGTATIGSTATGLTAGTPAMGGVVSTGGTITPVTAAGATVGTPAMPNTSPAGTPASTVIIPR